MMPDQTVPQDFSFPFAPYETQKQFMCALFNALEEEKLGIFESPTGTGKSLSLICGSLTWLNHHLINHKDSLKNVIEEIVEEDLIDWFNSTTKKIEKENEKRKAKKELDKIEKVEKKIKELKSKYKLLNKKHLKKIDGQCKEFKDSDDMKETLCNINNENESLPNEDEFLLEDYNSEGEASSESDSEDEGCMQIFYCSRTHSQLSQFVREIQKTAFRQDTRVSALASRKNLCVNPDVNQLSSLSLINERCIDMQNKKKEISVETKDKKALKKRKISNCCPFNLQNNIQGLSEQILMEVQDIEQLVTAGKLSKSCPYYASRKSIKDSQMIVLPYHSLLHRSTREACNIKLKGNIVIIDEAHNLLETIGNIHSAMLNYNQLCEANCQLSEYLRRFQKKLSPKNLLYIKQILFVINAYKRLLSNEKPLLKNVSFNPSSTSSRVLALQDFLFETLTDNLNIFKLIQYLENSRIAHKLHGCKKVFDGEVKIKINTKIKQSNQDSTSSFLAKMRKNGKSEQVENEPITNVENGKTNMQDEDKSSGSPLLGITEFLKAIKGGDGNGEGRIVVNNTNDADKRKSFIKYLLLNPASQFHDIVKECRAVILAGGTMSPVDEFKQQLFYSAGASPDRVVEFSCGHVVAEENVLPVVLTTGPCSLPMDFTYKNRKETKMLDELGRTLTNMCRIVPGGMVIFFPSYEYEDFVSEYFRKNKILEQISNKKKIFREPKKANQLDKILSDYNDAVNDKKDGRNGALLFSVVGGKMSEGINFSDDLGRCVVMVGLPYPNSTSPELKEKMDYLNKHYPPNFGKTAGATFYENLCFKAVNQSIGRSIRHKDDYGCILLLDQRYALESSRSNLSSWISSKVKVCTSFGQAVSLISKFFNNKKSSDTKII